MKILFAYHNNAVDDGNKPLTIVSMITVIKIIMSVVNGMIKLGCTKISFQNNIKAIVEVKLVAKSK